MHLLKKFYIKINAVTETMVEKEDGSTSKTIKQRISAY